MTGAVVVGIPNRLRGGSCGVSRGGKAPPTEAPRSAHPAGLEPAVHGHVASREVELLLAGRLAVHLLVAGARPADARYMLSVAEALVRPRVTGLLLRLLGLVVWPKAQAHRKVHLLGARPRCQREGWRPLKSLAVGRPALLLGGAQLQGARLPCASLVRRGSAWWRFRLAFVRRPPRWVATDSESSTRLLLLRHRARPEFSPAPLPALLRRSTRRSNLNRP